MAQVKANSQDELLARIAEAKGGDTILVEGEFGRVNLAGIRLEGGLTIASPSPGAAHFESVNIRGSSDLRISGISCWPLNPLPKSKRKPYLFNTDARSENIEITHSLFRGRSDSDKHTTWGVEDWRDWKIGAVFMRCHRGVVRDNAAIGVNFGYTVIGASSEIFNNTLFGFSGDGLRVGADNCVVIGNRITDAMQIDKNHPDGLQAFKRRGTLNGLVIKDNVILEWAVRPDNPLRARLQGIALHNGPYANVVVRDNSVACTSPNGIRLNSTENPEVIGNRVRHADGKRGKNPKIRLTNCWGNIVVEDNEAEFFALPDGVGRRNREPDYSVRY